MVGDLMEQLIASTLQIVEFQVFGITWISYSVSSLSLDDPDRYERIDSVGRSMPKHDPKLLPPPPGHEALHSHRMASRIPMANPVTAVRKILDQPSPNTAGTLVLTAKELEVLRYYFAATENYWSSRVFYYECLCERIDELNKHIAFWKSHAEQLQALLNEVQR